jgi:hypothetical protein
MTDLQPMPVIAELTNPNIPAEHSKYAIFLDGDANNTNEDNVLDEGYFNNCYCFDQFMEDYLVIDWLTLERDSLKVELQKAHDMIAQLLSQQSGQ